jgi:hypothetical protein
MTMLSRQRTWLLALALAAGFATPAHAYVGPGAGLSAIGTLLALLAACFLAFIGFVWYPIKRLLRRGKAGASDKARSSGT